ncbi:Brix domain-containing protein [Dipodascopsis tothii]|uniref:Brix domain-containing protein n=1 Tax=Dipodascopsis tothii TaxID=44089 RepID=UPI0034CDC482
MASLYRALSGTKRKAADEAEPVDATKFLNRQRVLVISSRGTTFRQRHLINDLTAMLPHGKKDSKLDTKSKLFYLNELAELHNCNNVLYFESRKKQDLYMYVAKAPNGPTAKFHVQNLHTMDELNFTGNSLKGSRPILSFDKTFDESPHNALVKELLLHTFGVPKGARKSKPFVDHVVAVSLVDNKVWFRSYQIMESIDSATKDAAGDGSTKRHAEKKLSLLEIGPRFVMTLITIFEGSFSGAVIYENKEYVSPNTIRAQLKFKKADERRKRAEQAEARKVRATLVSNDRHTRGDHPLSNAALFK